MAQPPSIIQDGILTYLRDGSPAQVAVDSSDWHTWLQTASTFTFHSERGSFTARKERAGNQRGRLYWRAYHTQNGKLHRAYLGKSEELTLERLRAIAATLAGQDAGGGSLNGQEQTAGTSVSPTASSHKGSRPHLQTPVANSVKARPFSPDLPVPLTPLIGREQERAALSHLLGQPEVRLVTLTGTGGVGKTRLALQAGAELREDFANGVCFVPLAPVRDPEGVLATIAQALGLREAAEFPLEAQVRNYLREKHLLLLLDNFEQIIATAPQLARLLTSCDHLRLLVTSRAALHLSGEHEFAVAPLAVPDLTQLPALADLAQVETVRLFVERAQAIKTDFALTEVNARAIAEICVRLDGLPLAIELAAARIKLLPPLALLKRLSHRLEVLTGGAQDLPARQQTLRNTLQWSYDLLTEQEQRLFRWLSIFVGGCTLEAAEALCQASQEGRERASSVLEGVTSLLDKSLVQQTEREGEAPRLVMLETLREFGLESLEQQGELEAIQRAHAGYYLKLAEETQQKLKGAQQGFWLERLEQEHDNLRAALRWLAEQEEVEMALRLGGALSQFWLMHGHLSEGRQWLEDLLFNRRRETVSPMGLDQVDIAAARAMSQEFLALGRGLGDQRIQAYALTHLGFLSLLQGEGALALPFLEESLAIFEALGDREGIGYNSLTFGWFSLSQSDPVAARLHYKKSLKMMIEINNKWFTAASLEGLAMAAALSAAGESIESALLAARLWGTADALREAIGVPLRSYERAFNEWGIASVRTRLGEKAFAAAWQEGRTMTPEQALVAQGPATIPPSIPAGSLSTPPTKTSPTYPAGLTAREVEVLRLVAQGMTDAQVAERLVISPRTVNFHLTSIYGKIGVSSRSAATRYAIEHHLI